MTTVLIMGIPLLLPPLYLWLVYVFSAPPQPVTRRAPIGLGRRPLMMR